ncbi:MAG: DnaJ-class molecular chaperone with C-terminal Zn finger domain [Rhodobacteraceae bacterium HLUCCA12]|nr:MAG: DnaJ-class molecular chaperone with C-terminal Zn finger domain [Rhodobacteraceae bacterium HLUCCA12]
MKGDPFNFDIRASADKKKRARGRRGMSGAVETSSHQCEHPGCTEPGLYRAPRSRDALDDYLWFCKEHVREYNLKWNFFAGQSEEEMLGTMERERVWGRATNPLGGGAREKRGWERLGIDDPYQVLGDKATRRPADAARPGASATRRLPPAERRALDILDARDTWSRPEIRRQYKSLVKDLHPDLNGGNRADEERLQEVVWAWDQIKDSRSFRD